MSARREHRRRYNERLEYNDALERWLARKPSRWRILSLHRWKRCRPTPTKDIKFLGRD